MEGTAANVMLATGSGVPDLGTGPVSIDAPFLIQALTENHSRTPGAKFPTVTDVVNSTVNVRSVCP